MNMKFIRVEKNIKVRTITSLPQPVFRVEDVSYTIKLLGLTVFSYMQAYAILDTE